MGPYERHSHLVIWMQKQISKLDHNFNTGWVDVHIFLWPFFWNAPLFVFKYGYEHMSSVNTHQDTGRTKQWYFAKTDVIHDSYISKQMHLTSIYAIVEQNPSLKHFGSSQLKGHNWKPLKRPEDVDKVHHDCWNSWTSIPWNNEGVKP